MKKEKVYLCVIVLIFIKCVIISSNNDYNCTANKNNVVLKKFSKYPKTFNVIYKVSNNTEMKYDYSCSKYIEILELQQLVRNSNCVNENNTISQLSDQEMTNLKIIYLSKCCIVNITPDTFKNMINVEKIVVYTNLITKLDSEVFQYNTNTKILNLRDNKLNELPENIFRTLKKIELINLFKNQLKYLPEGIFKYNANLKILHLEENNIETINLNVFPTSNNLIEITLHNNNWKCNCTIANVHSFLENIPMEIPPLCSKQKNEPWESSVKYSNYSCATDNVGLLTKNNISSIICVRNTTKTDTSTQNRYIQRLKTTQVKNTDNKYE